MITEELLQNAADLARRGKQRSAEEALREYDALRRNGAVEPPAGDIRYIQLVCRVRAQARRPRRPVRREPALFA